MSIRESLLTAGNNLIESTKEKFATIISQSESAARAAEEIQNNIIFPPDINTGTDYGSSTLFDRPVIVFSCERRGVTDGSYKISLPIPQGIGFSNGSSYDDSALGVSGYVATGGISAALNTASNGGGVLDVAKAAGVGSIGKIKDAFANPISIAARGLSMMKNDAVSKAFNSSARVSFNPHVVTEFTSHGTRSFSFSFKLIASTPEETKLIRDIGIIFTRGVYGEADILAIKYPPRWTIRFMLGNTDIKYIPKIWSCYLTDANVNYNGSANIFHNDGSPIECDIALTFKETRALTYRDIVNLETQPYSSKLESDTYKPISGQSAVTESDINPPSEE